MAVSAPKMTLIPGGDFVMGSEDHAANEAPTRIVWVDAFAISPYAVTTADYGLFLAATGHDTPPFWGTAGFSDARQPVVAASWFDAAAYCNWLSDLTGDSYRLLTEAEREKASRGGCTTAYPWGDCLPSHHRGGRHPEPARVDASDPNGYGLCGMASGVHEWCADWYADDYYAVAPRRNPRGPASTVRKVARGGSWRHSVRFTRCAARSSLAPDRHFSDFGFRVAMGVA